MSTLFFRFLMLSLTAFTLQSEPAPPSTAPATQPATPITLDEIQSRGIAGRLHLPLGTIAETSGEVVSNTSTAKIDSGFPFFLKITAVNGKPLDPPVLYPPAKYDSGFPLALKIGDHFRLVGYETGSFQGAPEGLANHVPIMATTRYAFTLEFVVIAVK